MIRHRQIKCFGVGESDLEQMLPDVIARGRQPSVGITVHKATITLRVTAEAESEAACIEAMQPTLTTIRECLGSLIFGEGDDELQHAVAALLRSQSQTLATMEWGSGGLLANWLSEANPQGDVFLGGLVVRNAAAFTATLGGIEQGAGADDEGEAICRMAVHARKQFGTDYGLALSAFPGESASVEEPGELQFAYATQDQVSSKSVPFTGHPDILKERAAKQALNFLRLSLVSS
ncbi:MAG: CinA family protein [Planctomycetia bacterium]|nr:CinA family protein [Planctomycetia bacterium]